MRLVFVLTAAVLSLHADVSLRYKIDSSAATLLPPGAEPDIQMKGAKGVTKLGRLTVIIDVAHKEITLLDPERKTFATFPADDFEKKSAQANFSPIPSEKAPEPPKFDLKTRKTGRANTIVGIRAEETEAIAALDLGDQAGMNLTMHVWTPAAGEVLRIPALREITALSLWYEHFLKVSGGDFEIPGTDGVLLRLEMEVRASGQAVPVDPTKPVFTMTLEATELSTAPLDDSLFTVPEGFAARPAEELLKNMNAAMTAVSIDAGRAEGAVQAFVPHLDPVEMEHTLKSDVPGMVRLLVTVGPDGRVRDAQPITGPEALRPLAVQEVRGYKYRPVLRDGHPVIAMTEAYVYSTHAAAAPVSPDLGEEVAASQRTATLQHEFPRTPQQVLADLEQDAGEDRKSFYAADLAKAALDAGDLAKAEAYAHLALVDKSDSNDSWNLGNRIHYGHIVLGRVALRRSDMAQAREHLLAAGKTTGSPQLDSFGPDLSLPRELLEKGEKGTVLAYLDEVRTFWKMGGSRLDAWTRDIQEGRPPRF